MTCTDQVVTAYYLLIPDIEHKLYSSCNIRLLLKSHFDIINFLLLHVIDSISSSFSEPLYWDGRPRPRGRGFDCIG